MMINSTHQQQSTAAVASTMEAISSKIASTNITDSNNFIFSSTEYGLNGMFLLSTACVFCLANFHTELATSFGYVLVTPIALLMSIYELIKPAFVICFSEEAMNSLIESVWRTAFGIRRVVVPRPEGYVPPNSSSSSSSSKTTRAMKIAEFLESDLQELTKLATEQRQRAEAEERMRIREKRGYNLNNDENEDDEYLTKLEREQEMESNRLYKQLVDEIIALKNGTFTPGGAGGNNNGGGGGGGIDEEQAERLKMLARQALGTTSIKNHREEENNKPTANPTPMRNVD